MLNSHPKGVGRKKYSWSGLGHEGQFFCPRKRSCTTPAAPKPAGSGLVRAVRLRASGPLRARRRRTRGTIVTRPPGCRTLCGSGACVWGGWDAIPPPPSPLQPRPASPPSAHLDREVLAAGLQDLKTRQDLRTQPLLRLRGLFCAESLWVHEGQKD